MEEPVKCVSFNSIAFQLKYSSAQIHVIYSLLDLYNQKDYMMSVITLKSLLFDLPEKFREWVEVADDNVNIIFEQRVLPKEDICFDDWDLIEY